LVLKKVAVTGASGMLGRHVLATLASRRVSALAVSRSRPDVIEPNASWQRWDLTEARSELQLEEMFPGAQAIMHVGAIVPHGESPRLNALLKANVEATFELGRWALKKRIPFVYVSGAVVYGETNEAGIRETHPTTYNCVGGAYGLSKLLGEQVLAELEGLQLTVVRPSSIYGSGLGKGMIADFLDQAAAGRTIELKLPVEDKVDLVHAADVAEAMVDALDHQAVGTYNLASEAPATILEIARACVESVGRGEVKTITDSADREPGLRFGLRCDFAREKFNFKARYSLSEGIREMWQHRQFEQGERQPAPPRSLTVEANRG
jgi:UDP-glucose 4-epimerase